MGVVQVGCIIVPTVGADCTGWAFITASDEAAEVQPDELVTVKEYVPAIRAVTVVVVPDPDEVTDPGFLVSVHVPEAGRLLKDIVPVDRLHVGCVIVPMEGASGAEGTLLKTISDEAGDVHPRASVTVKV